MVMGRQAGMERLFQSTPESGSSGKKGTEHSAQDAAACSGAEVEVVVVGGGQEGTQNRKSQRRDTRYKSIYKYIEYIYSI